MGIVNFLLHNWDSVLAVFAVGACVIFIIAKRQYAILDKIIFALVTEAEKHYGGGTGAIKMAAVIDWVYPKIPGIIRIFITAKQLTILIERILSDAKTKWQKNPNISTYIGKTPSV